LEHALSADQHGTTQRPHVRSMLSVRSWAPRFLYTARARAHQCITPSPPPGGGGRRSEDEPGDLFTSESTIQYLQLRWRLEGGEGRERPRARCCGGEKPHASFAGGESRVRGFERWLCRGAGAGGRRWGQRPAKSEWQLKCYRLALGRAHRPILVPSGVY
jgi:hypothetical protein